MKAKVKIVCGWCFFKIIQDFLLKIKGSFIKAPITKD
jgi:hypothetical protein